MWFIRVLAIMVACFAVPVTAMASMNSDPSWPKLPSVEVQRVEGERPTSDEIVVEILKRIAAANHAAAQKAAQEAAAEELADRQREQALQLELERKRQTVFKSSPDWDYWFYRELLEDGMTDEERNFMRDRAFDAESAKRAWHDVYICGAISQYNNTSEASCRATRFSCGRCFPPHRRVAVSLISTSSDSSRPESGVGPMAGCAT